MHSFCFVVGTSFFHFFFLLLRSLSLFRFLKERVKSIFFPNQLKSYPCVTHFFLYFIKTLSPLSISSFCDSKAFKKLRDFMFVKNIYICIYLFPLEMWSNKSNKKKRENLVREKERGLITSKWRRHRQVGYPIHWSTLIFVVKKIWMIFKNLILESIKKITVNEFLQHSISVNPV